jgi:hypothetical protein
MLSCSTTRVHRICGVPACSHVQQLVYIAYVAFLQVLPWMYYRDEAARITKANTQVAAASERELARVRTAVLQVCVCVCVCDTCVLLQFIFILVFI